MAVVERVGSSHIEALQAMESSRYPVLWAIYVGFGSIMDNYVPGQARVLDIGAGLGFGERLLSGRSGISYFSSDIDEGAIRFARDGIKRPLVAKAEQLPLADQSFEAVVMIDVITDVDDPGRCIAEAGRVLRPGGSFVNIQLNSPDPTPLLEIHKGYVLYPTLADPDILRKVSRPVLTDHIQGCARGNSFSGRQGLQELLGNNPKALDDARFHYRNQIGMIEEINRVFDSLPPDDISYLSVSDAYQKSLEIVLVQAGFTVVELSYRIAEILTERREYHRLDINRMYLHKGYLRVSNDPSIPEGQVEEAVMMQVTVGRK